jgi:hypothetical protein
VFGSSIANAREIYSMSLSKPAEDESNGGGGTDDDEQDSEKRFRRLLLNLNRELLQLSTTMLPDTTLSTGGMRLFVVVAHDVRLSACDFIPCREFTSRILGKKSVQHFQLAFGQQQSSLVVSDDDAVYLQGNCVIDFALQ